MPRKGSRADFVYRLAQHEAATWREVYGDPRVYAEDFYDGLQQLSTRELRELAEHLPSTGRGRPKGSRRLSRYTALIAEVEAVLQSQKRKSERGACAYVAAKAGVSAETLRKLRRSSRRGVRI